MNKNEQQCSTVNEQQCSTVNDQQCHNVLSQECSTVSEQECNSVPSQECSTVNKVVCSGRGGGRGGFSFPVVVGLDYPEAVDLDLEEVKVDLALLEDMEEVDLLQAEVMEQKGGKDGPLTLLEEVQADMEVDLGIAAEDMEEVVEGTVEVAEGLEEVVVEVVVDLAEVVVDSEEVRYLDSFT